MQAPEICKLNTDTTMKEVRKKAPFYVPEWDTEDERDSGIVLSNLFSGMVDSISSRLNEAPKKHFLSFLEMANTSLIPASPARAPLTFILSEGASEAKLIETSTQASADGPDGKAVIFETEKNILATPSKLVLVYSVIKEKDRIFNHFNHTATVNGTEITELFAGDSLQKHTLYIGDKNLFNVQKGHIIIEFGSDDAELKNLDPEQGLVEWKYSVESKVKENDKEVKKIEWQLLKAIHPENNLLVEKKLILDTENKPIDKVKLNGIESRWLMCQLKDSKIEELKNLRINSIKALTSPQEDLDLPQNSQSTSHSIIPDCLFSNDIPIDPNPGNLFYPFGKKPYLYDTFYIGSKDAFSKKGSEVTLLFGLIPGRPGSTKKADNSKNGVDSSANVDIPQLSWEFWDGESWSFLTVQGSKWEKNLCEKVESSEPCEPEHTTYELKIPEMPEVKLTRVTGKENYWVRVRLIGGNYGKEYEIISSSEITTAEGNKVSCAKIVPGSFFPPQITSLRINYKTETNDNGTSNGTDLPKQPEYVFTENNLIFRSCLEKLEKNEGFNPFESLPDIPPALYFGFDKELKKGPFSFFINIDESIGYPETFLPKVKWQYLVSANPDIWEELEVLDETAGFTKKGMVQFNIPGKMQAFGLFGSGNKYWIRAIITEDFFTDNRDFVNKILVSLYLKKVKEQEDKSLLNSPPAICLGFDKKIKNGPLNLSINLDQKTRYPESFMPKVKWQYMAKRDPGLWKELEVLDETEGLTKKGRVQFNIPRKMQTSDLFCLGDHYWIRAVLLEESFPAISDDIVNQILTSLDVADQVLTLLKVDSPQLKSQRIIKSSYFKKELIDYIQDFLVSSECVRSLKRLRPAISKELDYLNETLKRARIRLKSSQTETAELNGLKTDILPETQLKLQRSNDSVEKIDDFKIFGINSFSEFGLKFSPKIRGFYLNSVWAVQSKTIHDELLGSGNGEINQNFKLVNAPVISETVWINEFTTLSEKDRKTLLAEPNSVKLIQDSKGNITEFWVKWSQVNDFLDSESKDRYYTIDRTDGDISFGNGKHGMVPPIGSDNIKATYSIGGGKSGNFDASKISKLQSSIAFVDKVFNPISSSGGTETEDLDKFLKRAPTIFKKRDRATALEDYEWLAKKASDQVARVKALPNFNAEKKFSTGWVTVVIVPESSSSKPVPSSELKRRVTSYLKERCPAVVTLRVIPPYYVKIDVSAELITPSINAIPVIEKEVRNKISKFLHPLTGGNERNGWNFGGSVCVSDIYSILEQITDVDYVNKVIVNLYGDSGNTGSSMRLSDASSVAKLPVYALPYSGEHEIAVKLKDIEKEG